MGDLLGAFDSCYLVGLPHGNHIIALLSQAKQTNSLARADLQEPVARGRYSA